MVAVEFIQAVEIVTLVAGAIAPPDADGHRQDKAGDIEPQAPLMCLEYPDLPNIPASSFDCTYDPERGLVLNPAISTSVSFAMLEGVTSRTADGRTYQVAMLTTPDNLNGGLYAMSNDGSPIATCAVEILMDGTRRPHSSTMTFSITSPDGSTRLIPATPGVSSAFLRLEIPPGMSQPHQIMTANDVFVVDSGGRQLCPLSDFMRGFLGEIGADISPMVRPAKISIPPELIKQAPTSPAAPMSEYRGVVATTTPPPPPEIRPYARISYELMDPGETANLGFRLMLPPDTTAWGVTWAGDADIERENPDIQTLRKSPDPKMILTAMNELRHHNDRLPIVKAFLEFFHKLPPNEVAVLGNIPEATTTATTLSIAHPHVMPCREGLCIIGDSQSGSTTAVYLGPDALEKLIDDPHLYLGITSRDEVTRTPQETEHHLKIIIAMAQAALDGKAPEVYLFPSSIPLPSESADSEGALLRDMNLAIQGRPLEETFTYPVASIPDPGPGGTTHSIIFPVPHGTKGEIVGVWDNGAAVIIDPLSLPSWFLAYLAERNLEITTQPITIFIRTDFLLPIPPKSSLMPPTAFSAETSFFKHPDDAPEFELPTPGMTISLQLKPDPIETAVATTLHDIALEPLHMRSATWSMMQANRANRRPLPSFHPKAV